MKKKYRIFILLSVLCLLCSCAVSTPDAGDASFYFYYPSQLPENGALCQVSSDLDPAAAAPEEVLKNYLASDPPEKALSPIPDCWTLNSFVLEDSTAILSFTGTAAETLRASLACACLQATLLQLPAIEQISLMTPGRETPLLLNESSVLLKDTGMFPQNESVVLYLPDSRCRYLVRQTQTVEAVDAESKPRYVVEQLLSNAAINACIPEGTRLLDISVESGLCTVNLSSEFVQNMAYNFTMERLAVYSIVNTLTELPQIQTVDLWVAGAPLSRLNFMDLSASLYKKESLLAPKGDDVMDATLYVSCDGSLLNAIPQHLTPVENEDPLVTLMEALIAFDGEDGALRCIPEGTKLLSLRLEGDACIVDLTGEFLDGCKTPTQEQLAVHSIIATLCARKNVASVEILVEGLEPTYAFRDLENTTRPNVNWYARP